MHRRPNAGGLIRAAREPLNKSWSPDEPKGRDGKARRRPVKGPTQCAATQPAQPFGPPEGRLAACGLRKPCRAAGRLPMAATPSPAAESGALGERDLFRGSLVCCPANEWALVPRPFLVPGKGRRRPVAGPTQGGATRPGAKRATSDHSYLRDSILAIRCAHHRGWFVILPPHRG